MSGRGIEKIRVCEVCGEDSRGLKLCKKHHIQKMKADGTFDGGKPKLDGQPNTQERIKIVNWALKGLILPRAKHFLIIEDIIARWNDAWMMLGEYPDIAAELEGQGVSELCGKVISLSQGKVFGKEEAYQLLGLLHYFYDKWDIGNERSPKEVNDGRASQAH